MEYFDVLNKNREYTNRKLARGEKLKSYEFNQGVEVWILSPNNELLLTQRNELKSHPLTWEPPGGCTVAGESTVETAIREVGEEIGVNITSNDICLISMQLYKNQFVDIYVAKLDIKLDELILQTSEVSDAKWVTLNEFETMIENNEIVSYIMRHYESIKNKLKEYLK